MRQIQRAIAGALLLMLVATAASARTWYVALDGSGDAPTLHAAADSADAGDTILVGPGEYYILSKLVVPSRVVLESESGPHYTRILSGGPLPINFGVELQSHAELRGMWVGGFGYTAVTNDDDAILKNNIIVNVPLTIGHNVTRRCTIENNLFVGPVSLNNGFVNFNRNIVINGQAYCDGGNVYGPFCNNVQYNQCSALDNTANFSADPEFCGVPGSGNYYLRSTSPCAPGNTPLALDCGLIGPLPVGCGAVPVEKTTWGAVKSMYGSEEGK